MQQPQRQKRRQLARLINQLADQNKIRHLEAERQLWDMGPEAVEALCEHLNRNAHPWRLLLLATICWMGFYLSLHFLLSWLFGHPSDFSHWWGPALGGIITAFLTWAKVRNNAARVLAGFDDVRAVGPLAQALHFNAEIRPAIKQALLRLLPRLQASDAPLLNSEQRHCLHKTLFTEEAVFVKAILKALEQVGDESVIPFVERLIKEDIGRRPGGQVRAEAQSCLPFLRQHAEQNRLRQSLLRAASPTHVPADDLLRPASATAETEPQQLLRASVTDQRAEPSCYQWLDKDRLGGEWAWRWIRLR